jgi:Fic family protein
MRRGVQGEWDRKTTADEPFAAFLPRALPPDPPLRLDAPLHDLLERANRALGRLDAVSSLLPDPALFLYSYVRKEAVLSSQIEGTQSSLTDLLLFETEEAPGVPLDDVREVSRYVAALDHGLSRLRDGFPLCVRLLREVHRVLLAAGRGSRQDPGELRRSQNWIGGTRPGNAVFVPPPHEAVPDLMARLEAFLNDQPERTPTLVKAALAHVQFETIHPFLDGNGRVGRLLITLVLANERALQEPLLYLSLYFRTHRQRYYDLLQAVRNEGDWEAWLAFFLDGVYEVAQQASTTARDLARLFEADRVRIAALRRTAGSALRVHDQIRRHVLVAIPATAEATGLSQPTVTAALRSLEDLGIVRETTGRRRGRRYVYAAYLERLQEGIEEGAR